MTLSLSSTELSHLVFGSLHNFIYCFYSFIQHYVHAKYYFKTTTHTFHTFSALYLDACDVQDRSAYSGSTLVYKQESAKQQLFPMQVLSLLALNVPGVPIKIQFYSLWYYVQ